MKILVLTKDFYPDISGGAFTNWKTATELAAAGHTVVAVTPRTRDTPKHELKKGVEIRRPFAGCSEPRHPASPIGVLQQFKFCVLATLYLLSFTSTRQFDAVYVTNHMLHVTGKLLGLGRGLPVVNFVAYSPGIDESARRLTNPLYLLEQANFRYCMGNVVLCRTASVQEMVDEHSAAETMLVGGVIQGEAVRDAVSTETPPSLPFEPSVDDLLVFVGQLDENKNPMAAVEMLADLPDHRLLIIGDGPKRDSVERVAKRIGVEDRVALPGQRPHGETLRCIQAADTLVLTSDVEAYPTVVFEALALHTPVVATPVGVLPDVTHRRLTVAEIDEMPAVIAGVNTPSPLAIDEAVLDEYGIDRFVTTVSEVLLRVTQEAEPEPVPATPT